MGGYFSRYYAWILVFQEILTILVSSKLIRVKVKQALPERPSVLYLSIQFKAVSS